LIVCAISYSTYDYHGLPHAEDTAEFQWHSEEFKMKKVAGNSENLSFSSHN
jgi:hypothetical protein